MKENTLERRGPSEVFILLLTILALFNGAVLFFWSDSHWADVIRLIDVAISIIFLIDFAERLVRAPDRFHYLIRGWGWADFLGSFPFPGFRLFRLIRFVAIYRRLRKEGALAFRSRFTSRLSESTLLFVTFFLVLVVEFGSILVVAAEDEAPNANIRTGGEAIWWAFTTLSTTGYGDYVPVTRTGRTVGVLMMISGIALAGVFTAYIANSFFRRQRIQELGVETDAEKAMRGEIRQLSIAVAELRLALEQRTGESSQRPTA